MAPRREILDSEDDSSDFGDGAEPDYAESHEAEIAGDGPHEFFGAPDNNPSTDSADPAFSQPISGGQQGVSSVKAAAPDRGPNDASATAWTETSSAPPSGQKPLTGESLLTSITDPAPKGRKSKRSIARNDGQPETIDLTNITTPGKGSASEAGEVWDVPSSTSPQKATGRGNKRKTAQPSLEQESMRSALPSDTQDPYAFPDATPPPRKRSRRGTPPSAARQSPASSPVSLIPTEELPGSDRRARSSGKKKTGSDGGDATLPDTAPPSLYITQSSLTASQKREYQVVDLSSEAMREVPRESDAHESFPAVPSSEAGGMYRSSMATTVAYPTPSRAAMQWQLSEAQGEASDECVSRTLSGYDFGYPQSSPDVLTDMTSTTAAPKSKKGKANDISSTGHELSEHEPPSSTRRAKKRKVIREVDNDNQEPDPLGTSRENVDTPPQAIETQRDFEEPSQAVAKSGKDKNGEGFVPEADPADAGATEKREPASKPAAKGKRGRKKKDSKSQAAAAEPDEPAQAGVSAPAETAPEAAETAEPPAKRKRGRLRKSEASKPQPEPGSEEEQTREQEQPKEDAGSEFKVHTAPQPLAEVDHQKSQPDAKVAVLEPGNTVGKVEPDEKENKITVETDASAAAVAATATDKMVKEEKQAIKDVIKPTLPKVPYRVGLSKRTRIAPLLKSLKKPA